MYLSSAGRSVNLWPSAEVTLAKSQSLPGSLTVAAVGAASLPVSSVSGSCGAAPAIPGAFPKSRGSGTSTIRRTAARGKWSSSLRSARCQVISVSEISSTNLPVPELPYHHQQDQGRREFAEASLSPRMSSASEFFSGNSSPKKLMFDGTGSCAVAVVSRRTAAAAAMITLHRRQESVHRPACALRGSPGRGDFQVALRRDSGAFPSALR